MGHGHSHSHHGAHQGHDHEHAPDYGRSSRAIVRALIITGAFMVIEAVGGYFAGSLALLSDAGHMLVDVGALLLSLFALWLGQRPSTPRLSFGYHRAEILGALLSGLLIWLMVGALVFEAVERMREPQAIQAPLMLATAVAGLVANLLSLFFLRAEKHGHLNVRAAYLHVLYDSLGSVTAILAGSVIWATGTFWIDPLVTFFLCGFMLWGSWGLIRDSVEILMESAPTDIDPQAVRKDLEGLAQIREAHDLHIWTVASGRKAMSVHLISEDGEGALKQAHDLLEQKYGIVHTTIQVEHPTRFKSERCYDCG